MADEQTALVRVPYVDTEGRAWWRTGYGTKVRRMTAEELKSLGAKPIESWRSDINVFSPWVVFLGEREGSVELPRNVKVLRKDWYP